MSIRAVVGSMIDCKQHTTRSNSNFLNFLCSYGLVLHWSLTPLLEENSVSTLPAFNGIVAFDLHIKATIPTNICHCLGWLSRLVRLLHCDKHLRSILGSACHGYLGSASMESTVKHAPVRE